MSSLFGLFWFWTTIPTWISTPLSEQPSRLVPMPWRRPGRWRCGLEVRNTDNVCSDLSHPPASWGTMAKSFIFLEHQPVKVTQSCPTFCDPVDYRPPGSSVHGILQARILEWVAISSFRGSSWPRNQTHVSYVCICRRVLFRWRHLGNPLQSLSASISRILFILHHWNFVSTKQ